MKADFKCYECNIVEEKSKKIGEDWQVYPCPKCQKPMKKVFSSSSIKTSDGYKQ